MEFLGRFITSLHHTIIYLFIYIYLFSPPRKRNVLRPTLAMVVHLFDVCPVIETTELTRAANQQYNPTLSLQDVSEVVAMIRTVFSKQKKNIQTVFSKQKKNIQTAHGQVPTHPRRQAPLGCVRGCYDLRWKFILLRSKMPRIIHA